MLKEQLKNLKSKPASEGAFQFEALVFELLTLHLNKQGKALKLQEQIGLSKSVSCDALAPEGFDDFDGQTIIEIKLRLSSRGLRQYIEGLVLSNSFEAGKTNLLIICANQVASVARKDVKSILLAGHFKKVEIWGPEDLEEIASSFPEEAESIVNSIFRLTIEHTLTRSTDDWKGQRDNIVLKLKSSFDASQFSLFLGAGVSASVGMPDWGSLLNSLFVSLLTKQEGSGDKISADDITKLVERVNRLDDLPALLSARYLRRGLSKSDNDDSEFIEEVRNNLYNLRDKKRDIASPLIKSITALCTPQRTGARVQSVVTYNFDDLLERQLKEKDLEYKSITVESDEYGTNELPIFHVHGYLPEGGENSENSENISLVFSEEGYHRIYADPYHWSNLVQLNCLRDNVCLMVGLSMTDPNLRRLLEISGRSRSEPKHFALMRRMTLDQFCEENGSLERFENEPAAAEFLNRHHNLNELVLAELGVTIVWYESYDEIPNILNSLKK